MKEVKAYKISIIEIGTEERFMGKEWREGAGEMTSDQKYCGYGYTPEIIKVCSYEEIIYEQTVKDLDLSAVVLVINKIDGNQ